MQTASSSSQAAEPAQGQPRLIPQGYGLLFALVTTLFFLWAIPNNLNDVLIRQFMKSFVMTRFGAGLVQSAFYLGYFVLAMPAAMIMRKWGYKSGFLMGLALFSLGCFLFWPAALISRYWAFLTALFVIASGLSFLETASNPFIAQLGDPRTAARRLNLAQAFNPLGSVTGALVGTVFIFSGIELRPDQVATLQARHEYTAYLHSETMRVVAPYVVLSVITFLMLLLIAATRFPSALREAEKAESQGGRLSELLHHRHFLLAIAAQFAYVGAQVGTWSYLIPYIQSYVHAPEKLAGYLLTGSLVLFGIGRFFSAWLMRFVNPSALMTIYAALNVGLVAVGVLLPGWPGVYALVLTSFFMSVMFPTIFAQGIRGLGANTKIAGSLLVMSIVGGAVLTPIMGLISSAGMGAAYIIPLLAYVLIAFYSFADLRILRKTSFASKDFG